MERSVPHGSLRLPMFPQSLLALLAAFSPQGADRPELQRTALEAEATAVLQFDVDERGRYWVRGTGYKASFGPEGTTFVPFLGSAAERNHPVRFELAAAQQGATQASLAQVRVSRDGNRFVLDRGALKSEYVAGLGGLEQLFVLDAPLADAGDLVLHLDVDTDLAAQPDGTGWRFENELGGVAYGAAFVLDAAGHKLDLATERTPDGLRFRVPERFLARATWPIAVDPLITPLAVDTTPIDHYDADVAYDPGTQRYLVTFTEVFSAADHDIKSWLVEASGAVVPASDRYLDFTGNHRTWPRVACTNARRAFLCVYSEGAVGAGRRIGARARFADNSAIGPAFFVDENTAVERVQPDVCGDSYTSSADAHFTVVWRRFWDPSDSDIVARVVHEDGVPITPELYVTNIVGVSDTVPSISKCIAPGTEDSVVVWKRGADTVLASLISYNGGLVRDEIPLATAASFVGRPRVSALSSAPLLGSSNPTFVAVWDVDYGTDRDVEGVVVAAANTLAAPLVSGLQYLSFMEHVDFALDQSEPDVACVGERWIITQNATFPGATDTVTRATTVGIVSTELALSERFLPLTQTFQNTFTPRLATRFEAGEAASLEALTAWDQLVGFTPPGAIHGAVHAAEAAEPCAIQFVQCQGNPNGTHPFSRSFLWIEGDTDPSTTKRMHAVDLHANAFGYFLVSPQVSPTGGVTPPGSVGVLCLDGSIGRYSNQILNSGADGTFSLDLDPTSIPQPTGAVSALSGQLWFFQAWHRDVRPGGGTPTSNFTNAVGLPFL